MPSSTHDEVRPHGSALSRRDRRYHRPPTQTTLSTSAGPSSRSPSSIDAPRVAGITMPAEQYILDSHQPPTQWQHHVFSNLPTHANDFYSYHSMAGSVPATMTYDTTPPMNAYPSDLIRPSFEDHNPNGFHNDDRVQWYDYTQENTNFGFPDLPGSDSSLPMQSSNSYSPYHGLQGCTEFGPSVISASGYEYSSPYSSITQFPNTSSHTPHHESQPSAHVEPYNDPSSSYSHMRSPHSSPSPRRGTNFAPPIFSSTHSLPSHTPSQGSQRQWRNSEYLHIPVDPGLHSQPSTARHRINQNFVNYAPPRGQPHQGSPHHNISRSHTREFYCRWLHEDYMSCEFRGSLDELKEHFTTHLSGPAHTPTSCRWEGCNHPRRGNPTMRRDTTWRHVLEIHLGIKRRKSVARGI